MSNQNTHTERKNEADGAARIEIAGSGRGTGRAGGQLDADARATAGWLDGRVEQGNFDTYQLLRINETPVIEVHIVQSSEPPGGMGEPGTVPAVANAIFAATGKRLRKMPVDSTVLGQPA